MTFGGYRLFFKHQRQRLGLGLGQLPWMAPAIGATYGMVAWPNAVARLGRGEDRQRQCSGHCGVAMW